VLGEGVAIMRASYHWTMGPEGSGFIDEILGNWVGYVSRGVGVRLWAFVVWVSEER
jgi:hypothetical protein